MFSILVKSVNWLIKARILTFFEGKEKDFYWKFSNTEFPIIPNIWILRATGLFTGRISNMYLENQMDQLLVNMLLNPAEKVYAACNMEDFVTGQG